jgi:hypothetical protein
MHHVFSLLPVSEKRECLQTRSLIDDSNKISRVKISLEGVIMVTHVLVVVVVVVVVVVRRMNSL